MELNIKNKVAVVTGAGRGIGKSIAYSLAEEKVNLILNDLDEDLIKNSIDKIKNSYNTKIDYCIGDVSKENIAKCLIGKAIDRFGQIDILINNAGISPKPKFEEITTDDFDRVLRINLRSTFLCSKFALKEMKKRKSGRIINLSSLAGRFGGKFSAVHYSASKAGIIGLTMTLARQFGQYNITVNSVAPGRMDTHMTNMLDKKTIENIKKRIPLKRLGTAKDVANTVVFLASEAAGYINGACIDITGGYLP